MADEKVNQGGDRATETVEMPAPTAWLISLAFGMTLICAGLVTGVVVSVLGAVVVIAGAMAGFAQSCRRRPMKQCRNRGWRQSSRLCGAK